MGITYQKYTGGGWNDASHDHTFTTNSNRVLAMFATYVGVSAAASATSVTVGGNAATSVVNKTNGTEPSISVSCWLYRVPATISGSATVTMAGGAGTPILYIMEISDAYGTALQTATDTDDTVTLNGTGSLCINMVTKGGASTPSIDGTATLVNAANHDDADNRLDSGWGVSYEKSPGAITFDWDSGDKSHVAVELKATAGGTQVIMM